MEVLLNGLLDPIRYPFMMRGLLASLMVGVVCSLVGTYIVLRGMAFFGDALAHAILTATGIGALSTKGQIKEDTAIGVIFAGAFALGVAMLSTVRSYATDLAHILFGNVLGVGLGLLILKYRNELLMFMSSEFNLELLPPELYQLSRLPSHTMGSDVAIVCGLVLVFCTLAGLVPALRAARMEPVDALRYE